MATPNALRDLVKRVVELERRVKSVGSGTQLANSSIEGGALQAYNPEGDQTMVIGRQWDDTYTAAVVNGPTPPTPTSPTSISGSEGASIRWDGTFVGGAIVPMDFLRVDLYLSQSSGFTPAPDNRFCSFVQPTGGECFVGLAPGTWYAKMICWSQAGVPSAVSAEVSVISNAIVVSTDGNPPASSPGPEVLAGIESMHVRWTPITNADPVWYDVHVSTTIGFTPDSTTLVGTTQASQYVIKALPGTPPVEGEDDPRKLQYGTIYYVRIVARDADGSAAPGLQQPGQIFQATGINLAADSVTTAQLLAGSVTGEKFAATVILSGLFKTADSGQRIEMGITGIQGYKSDGTLMLSFPTDPAQQALIDAEIIARRLTITNGANFRGTSQVEVDADIELLRGTAAPKTSPQPSATYLTKTPSTSSLTDAQRTGTLGTFNLIPSEVSFIEWKAAADTWVIHQVRPNGTRAWFFDYDGNPITWTGGVYFTDYKDWEIWSVIEITTSTSAKNGVYRMARWIPAGSNNTFYLMCPQGIGFNRYSRLNSAAPPVVGTNGTDVFVAEVASNQLNIRYFTPNGDGNNLSAPVTVYQSATTTKFSNTHPLSQVFFDANGFDTGAGAGRYIVGVRGYNDLNRIVYTSGTNLASIHPGGVTAGASSWTSANVEAQSFESNHASPRCIAWMPEDNAFWTYGGDGSLREYTSTFWDPAVTSSTVWLQQSFYDSVGTVHETTPSQAVSYTWPRRSKIGLSFPPLPGAGGAEDPNSVRVYAGRGSSQPSNANMWAQGAGYPGLTITTLATSGSNPLTVSTFPNSNPGRISNDDDSLVISGDGSVLIPSGKLTVGTVTIVEQPPYWFGYISSDPTTVAGLVIATITGWVADGSPNSVGITHSSGNFTVPIAGTYELSAQVWWAGISGATGHRLAQWCKTPATPVVIQSSTVNSSAATGTNAGYPALNLLNKKVRLAANDQVFVRFRHGDTVNRSPTGSSTDITWAQVRYVGP